jgi:acylphosphatase
MQSSAPRERLRICSIIGGNTRVRTVKPNMLCTRCLVSGRVQGVFYRATAQQRAQELGLRGYARNLPDGRVEVLACGEPASVAAYIGWLWTGSSASKVTAVEVAEVPVDALDGQTGFFTA